MHREEYVRNVILSILKEEANQGDVVDAIRKKYEVNITYDDGANGPRRIQPCVYGKTSRGNLVLRAYQPEGSSNTSSHGWKFFLLDKINNWQPLKDSHFSEPPEFKGDGEYNTNGDRSMSEVYLVADFGNAAGGEPETNTVMHTGNPEKPEAPVTNTGSGVSGIEDAAPQANPYSKSSKEMMTANNFSDVESSETVGPVMKGNTDTSTEVEAKPVTSGDYTNVERNAPIYKSPEPTERPEEVDADNINSLQFADDNEEEKNF